MARHGQLVRMQDGRLARFQERAVEKGANPSLSILVAVEIDPSTEASLDYYFSGEATDSEDLDGFPPAPHFESDLDVVAAGN